MSKHTFGEVSTWWCHTYYALSKLLRWIIHFSDVIIMASQTTGVSVVFSTVCSGTDQRKHQSSASLAFMRGIHRWPVDSPHKGPVTRKCFHLMTSSWNAEAVMIILPIINVLWIYGQVTATHLMIGFPYIKSTGTRSSKKLLPWFC